MSTRIKEFEAGKPVSVLSFNFMIYDYFNVDEFEAGKLVPAFYPSNS
jgi:hypothetical protein